ncbi:hypothetical protein COOONC_01597 [Cooperia oncophora]
MANDMKEAFHGMLVEEDWMDNATKKAASGKLQKMLIKVAYPEFILNSRKLDNYYDNKNSDSYSQMVEKLSRWNIEYDLKRLSKPVDRTEYDFNAAVVNAYYDSTSNSIKYQESWWRRSGQHRVSGVMVEIVPAKFLNIKLSDQVPGTTLKLNGKLTQGENIADNGGLKLAFRAYKKVLKKHGSREADQRTGKV